MKKVIFISIDMPKRWSQWHSGQTDSVYYSEFLNDDEVNVFLDKIKKDYPDSNLMDGKGGHEYYIEYIVLNFDENDTEGFKILRNMMRAYESYK